jgi:hypothetical protein
MLVGGLELFLTELPAADGAVRSLLVRIASEMVDVMLDVPMLPGLGV